MVSNPSTKIKNEVVGELVLVLFYTHQVAPSIDYILN